MTPGGEWFIDRDRIIDDLLKRDKALRENKPQPSHVVHVNGDMYGSSIQQGTSASIVTINFKAIELDVRTSWRVSGTLLSKWISLTPQRVSYLPM